MISRQSLISGVSAPRTCVKFYFDRWSSPCTVVYPFYDAMHAVHPSALLGKFNGSIVHFLIKLTFTIREHIIQQKTKRKDRFKIHLLSVVENNVYIVKKKLLRIFNKQLVINIFESKNKRCASNPVSVKVFFRGGLDWPNFTNKSLR